MKALAEPGTDGHVPGTPDKILQNIMSDKRSFMETFIVASPANTITLVVVP
jgi:hypothetical protein